MLFFIFIFFWWCTQASVEGKDVTIKRALAKAEKGAGKEEEKQDVTIVTKKIKKKNGEEGEDTEETVEKAILASQKNKIFVGGLPKDVKSKKLKKFFTENYGAVVQLILKKDQYGESKGFGFITFENNRPMNKAIAHSLKKKCVFMGLHISCKPARDINSKFSHYGKNHKKENSEEQDY